MNHSCSVIVILLVTDNAQTMEHATLIYVKRGCAAMNNRMMLEDLVAYPPFFGYPPDFSRVAIQESCVANSKSIYMSNCEILGLTNCIWVLDYACDWKLHL